MDGEGRIRNRDAKHPEMTNLGSSKALIVSYFSFSKNLHNFLCALIAPAVCYITLSEINMYDNDINRKIHI